LARIYLLFDGKTAGDRAAAAITAIEDWSAALVRWSGEFGNSNAEIHNQRKQDADVKEATATTSRDEAFQELSRQIRGEGRLKPFRGLVRERRN
jgi:hypothetical protein